MHNAIRVSLIAVCSLGLFACGGAKIAHNKEAAAQAAFASGRGANTTQSPLRMAMEAVTTASSSATASCPNGGSVSVQIDLSSIDSTTGDFSFVASYDHCNYDGANSLNGHVTMTMHMDSTDPYNVSMGLHMAGRVEFSGEISDFVDMDITETIAATAVSSTSGSVTVTLNGTIDTSADHWVYSNETITITADGIEPAQS